MIERNSLENVEGSQTKRIYLDTAADIPAIGASLIMCALPLASMVEASVPLKGHTRRQKARLTITHNGKEITFDGVVDRSHGSRTLLNPDSINDDTKTAVYKGVEIEFKISVENIGRKIVRRRYFECDAKYADKEAGKTMLHKIAQTFGTQTPVNEKDAINLMFSVHLALMCACSQVIIITLRSKGLFAARRIIEAGVNMCPSCPKFRRH